MKKKRNVVILWKKRNNSGKNIMVGSSVSYIYGPKDLVQGTTVIEKSKPKITTF